MSTVGKVLVILNLVAALATGSFLAYDFVVRSNWKHHAESCERELTVARANTAAMKRTFEELDRQARNALHDLESEKQNRKNDDIVRKIQMDEALRKFDDESQKSHDAEHLNQKFLTENKRLKQRVAELVKLLEDRNQFVVQKEKENRQLRLDSVVSREKAESTIGRNQELLEQLAEARRKLAEMETGSSAFTLVASVDPDRANPPPTAVQGVIEKVDARDGLIEISAGSDQGLKRYQTLEVFRLQPQAQYLGRLRILDVYEHKAIGRLVHRPLTGAHPVQPGDQVASSLDRH